MKKILLTTVVVSAILIGCDPVPKGTQSTENTTEQVVETKAQFSDIDVTKQNEIISQLQSADASVRKVTIEQIIANPNDYNPPVLYALSRALFQQNEKDEAMYWFYVGQLRARYDANICLDESAKQAVGVLNNEYGTEINQFAFQDLTKLEETVNKVVEFVRSNEEKYDHRWINLHGMEAVNAGLQKDNQPKEMSKPQSEWEAIKKKTIDDYYNGFIAYVKEQK